MANIQAELDKLDKHLQNIAVTLGKDDIQHLKFCEKVNDMKHMLSISSCDDSNRKSMLESLNTELKMYCKSELFKEKKTNKEKERIVKYLEGLSIQVDKNDVKDIDGRILMLASQWRKIKMGCSILEREKIEKRFAFLFKEKVKKQIQFNIYADFSKLKLMCSEKYLKYVVKEEILEKIQGSDLDMMKNYGLQKEFFNLENGSSIVLRRNDL